MAEGDIDVQAPPPATEAAAAAAAAADPPAEAAASPGKDSKEKPAKGGRGAKSK